MHCGKEHVPSDQQGRLSHVMACSTGGTSCLKIPVRAISMPAGFPTFNLQGVPLYCGFTADPGFRSLCLSHLLGLSAHTPRLWAPWGPCAPKMEGSEWARQNVRLAPGARRETRPGCVYSCASKIELCPLKQSICRGLLHGCPIKPSTPRVAELLQTVIKSKNSTSLSFQ